MRSFNSISLSGSLSFPIDDDDYCDAQKKQTNIQIMRKHRKEELAEVVFKRHASQGVILHAVYARLYVGLSFDAIGEAYGKSPSTIHCWVQRYLRNPHLFLRTKTHKSRRILPEHELWVINFVMKFPLSYLREIQRSFQSAYFKVSVSSIFQILTKHKITNKVLEDRSIEIQTDEISRFCLEVNQLKPLHSQLVFLDESSFDNRSLRRTRGWFFRGSRPVHHSSFQRTERISTLTFLGVNGVLDHFVTDKTFSTAEFFQCVRKMIQKGVVSPYPGLNSVWVMDGAKIHINAEVIDYLFSVGIYVLYLPPYCPFYNPTEFFFNLVKKKCQAIYYEKGTEMVTLLSVFDDLSSIDMSQIFHKCGYSKCGDFDPSDNYEDLE